MKKLLYITLFLVAINLLAQTEIELENQLEKASGAEKLDVLIELSEHFAKTHSDKAIAYGKEAIELSDELSKPQKKVKALINMGLYYLHANLYSEAQDKFQKAYIISDEKKYQKEMALIVNYIGVVYYQKGQFNNAVEYFTKAEKEFTKKNDQEGASKALNNLGLVHWKWNKYTDALEFFNKSLMLKETIKDSAGIAATLSNIGNVYKQLEKYEEALSDYHKALIIYDHLGDDKGLADCYNNIGIIHRRMDDPDKALEYFNRSSKIRKEINDVKGYASCLNNIGNIYENKSSFHWAKEYYQQALEKFNLIQDNHGIALVTSNLGNLEFHEKRYNSALRLVNESNDIAKKESMRSIIRDNYDILSRIYAAKGDFKSALSYFKLFAEMKEVFFNEELKKVTEMKVSYETKQKEKEIELLKKEQEIKELQLASQKSNIKFLIILLVFISILFIVSLERYLRNRKTKVELEKHTTQLESVAKTDTLTKVPNKKDLIEHMEMEQRRFARNNKSFVIMITDLDDFKRINDQYGNEAGDFVLRFLTNMIRRSIRRHDIIGRWSGQKFLLILPETGMQGGQIISEKIRKKVSTNPISYQDKNIYVTMTIGLTIYTKPTPWEKCLEKAEEALQKGKDRGKNCVIITTT